MADGIVKAPKAAHELWAHEIEVAEKELKKFHTTGDRVKAAFLAKASQDETGLGMLGNDLSLYNVFWANTEILQAALYANPPKPVVKREFYDPNDDAARVAATIMERMLKRGVNTPISDMHSAFTQSVQDYLLPGLGQIWFRYEPKTQKVNDPEAGEYEQLLDEKVCTDYVHWKDFLWSPARVWEEVRWAARLVRMTEEEGLKRFGKIFKKVQMENTPKSDLDLTPKEDAWKKGCVYEIWDKTSMEVVWWAKGVPQLLDKRGDPLELEGFFPCPKPLLATHTTDNLVPRADYTMVQDQYAELHELNTRLRMLEKACKLVGVYDKAQEGIKRIFNQAVENQLIPVENWALFAEKGGIKGVIDWVPIDMVAEVITQLQGRKQDLIQQVYELTGLSDIMRGVSAPRETLGAQQMKAQYSSSRLQLKQMSVASFVQQGMKIKGDIISKHFRPETILRQSLIMYTDDQQYATKAVELLKSEWDFQYRLEIETDSMSIPDYNAERQARVEYATAVGQYISQVWPLIESQPAVAPFFLRMLQWVSAGFRASSQIETVLDNAIKNVEIYLEQKAQQPPPPDPAMVKAEADVKAIQMKTEADVKGKQMKTAADLKVQQAKTAGDLKAQQMKLVGDQQAQEQEQEMSAQQHQSDMQQDLFKTLSDIMLAAKKAEAQPAKER
jgi:hypothetical protein